MAAVNSSKSPTSTDLLLSLAIGPLLIGVLATDAACSWLQALGISSGEVFRGERLPLLHLPDSSSETETPAG